jgi:hypothetical protein
MRPLLGQWQAELPYAPGEDVTAFVNGIGPEKHDFRSAEDYTSDTRDAGALHVLHSHHIFPQPSEPISFDSRSGIHRLALEYWCGKKGRFRG